MRTITSVLSQINKKGYHVHLNQFGKRWNNTWNYVVFSEDSRVVLSSDDCFANTLEALKDANTKIGLLEKLGGTLNVGK